MTVVTASDCHIWVRVRLNTANHVIIRGHKSDFSTVFDVNIYTIYGGGKPPRISLLCYLTLPSIFESLVF